MKSTRDALGPLNSNVRCTGLILRCLRPPTQHTCKLNQVRWLLDSSRHRGAKVDSTNLPTVLPTLLVISYPFCPIDIRAAPTKWSRGDSKGKKKRFPERFPTYPIHVAYPNELGIFPGPAFGFPCGEMRWDRNWIGTAVRQTDSQGHRLIRGYTMPVNVQRVLLEEYRHPRPTESHLGIPQRMQSSNHWHIIEKIGAYSRGRKIRKEQTSVNTRPSLVSEHFECYRKWRYISRRRYTLCKCYWRYIIYRWQVSIAAWIIIYIKTYSTKGHKDDISGPYVQSRSGH